MLKGAQIRGETWVIDTGARIRRGSKIAKFWKFQKNRRFLKIYLDIFRDFTRFQKKVNFRFFFEKYFFNFFFDLEKNIFGAEQKFIYFSFDVKFPQLSIAGVFSVIWALWSALEQKLFFFFCKISSQMSQLRERSDLLECFC